MLNLVNVYQNEINQYSFLIEKMLDDEIEWDAEQYQTWQDKIVDLKYKIDEYILKH